MDVGTLEKETPGIAKFLNNDSKIDSVTAKKIYLKGPVPEAINARLCQLALTEGLILPTFSEGELACGKWAEALKFKTETLPVIEKLDIPTESTVKRAIAYNKYITICLSVSTGCAIALVARLVAQHSVNAALAALN